MVVEDRAYDGLDVVRGQVAPSIGSWTDRVLTTGTVSKTLAPGRRVGWVVGPPDLLDPLRRAKQVAFVPGTAFAATRDGTARLQDRLRLSFATQAEDELDEAACRLAASV